MIPSCAFASEQVINELSELVNPIGFQDQLWKIETADGRCIFRPNVTAGYQNGEVGADSQKFLCKFDAAKAWHEEITHHGVEGFGVGVKYFQCFDRVAAPRYSITQSFQDASDEVDKRFIVVNVQNVISTTVVGSAIQSDLSIS
jgi:hypothetical protein